MNWTSSLPPPLLKALKAETAGERINWVSQPNALRSSLQTTPVWFFAIPWTAFSLFMFGMMAAGPWSGKAVPETLGNWGVLGVFVGMVFMIPFLVIGFAMMASPFWVYWKARQTVYAITDKRLIILTEGRSRKVQGIEPHAMQQFTRTEKRNGSGSLKITLGFRKDSDGDTVETQETISNVAGVRRAEQLLQELRSRHKV